MVLSTSRPFKHPDTHVYYFRKAVPADLRATIGKWEVRRSLKTKNQAEARERYAKVAAEIAAEWKRLRSLPEGLTKREALALAGRWYVWFTAQHEDEPGDDDFGWALLAEQLADFDLQTSGLLDERDDLPSGWARGQKTEARVRAFLSQHGRVEAFMREAGISLSADGLTSFYESLEPHRRAPSPHARRPRGPRRRLGVRAAFRRPQAET